MSRKHQDAKAFSKIMKIKKNTGKIQEVPLSQILPQCNDQLEEQPYQQQQLSDQQFQDQFEDQYEQEQGWVSDSGSEENDEDAIQSEEGAKNTNTQEIVEKTEIFMGTKKNLKKGEVLDFDNNAYDMLHRLNIEWPSLSIDFVCHDNPFSTDKMSFIKMNKYPYEVYTVQGSSNNTQKNSIYLTKWRKLHKTKYDDDPDVEGDSEDEDLSNDEQPQAIAQQIETTYPVNRIRSLAYSPIVAFWNDQGQIHIMDLIKNFQKLKNNIGTKKSQQAKQIILQSESEGYALSWNPHKIGQIVTGNVLGKVEVFENNEGYTSWSRSCLFSYHKNSVEDIVFSPNQPTVFATCSSDGTLQIVDMRVGNCKKSQILIKAHDKDVNVCDWSTNSTNLIVTGSDDCTIKVWDLRKQKQKNKSEQLISFSWHSQPISSIAFQPHEESMIAVASQDNSISIWDMAMQNQIQDTEIPNELMFIHQGQQQIKQIAFHPIYYQMIVSTALDGINMFKPSYEMPEEQQIDIKYNSSKPNIYQKKQQR